ncbi:MAG: hypothetical protein J3K34DRAFT_517917 [Monoraphidium minutum]|nr:MAG: hypothetical protein J3K34DRAFT_517917 [Monoraphidium minutum]
MRLLFIAIEFSTGTFSGNGVYGKCQVEALAAQGHEVFVIAGRPAADGAAAGAAESSGGGGCGTHVAAAGGGGLPYRLHEVPLPVWGRLDRRCGWEALAAGAGAGDVAEAVAAFGPEAALGVDWHSLFAYRSLCAALEARGAKSPPVYLRTAEGEDAEFMAEAEGGAVAAAVLVTCLSRSDAAVIAARLMPPGRGDSEVEVLLPALRSDMAHMPLPADVREAAARAGAALRGGGFGARPYLTCCVRLSPEKEPLRFVELVAELQRRGALQRHGLVPLMVGAADSEYARRVKAALREAAPGAVVEERFLGPRELVEQVYARTRLNVHPCTYDAYGMTVVEAAAQGAPSLVNAGGHVGATDLLSGAAGECFEVAIDAPAAGVADAIEALLADPARLAAVGGAAAARARAWELGAYAVELAALVQRAIAPQHERTSGRATGDGRAVVAL